MDRRDFEKATRELNREGMHDAGAELDPREPRCEHPECRTPGRRGAWVVWSKRYPSKRHVLCSDCLEPFVATFNELPSTKLGELELEPVDPHATRPGVLLPFGLPRYG